MSVGVKVGGGVSVGVKVGVSVKLAGGVLVGEAAGVKVCVGTAVAGSVGSGIRVVVGSTASVAVQVGVWVWVGVEVAVAVPVGVSEVAVGGGSVARAVPVDRGVGEPGPVGGTTCVGVGPPGPLATISGVAVGTGVRSSVVTVASRSGISAASGFAFRRISRKIDRPTAGMARAKPSAL